jgi:hypothetical protein
MSVVAAPRLPSSCYSSPTTRILNPFSSLVLSQYCCFWKLQSFNQVLARILCCGISHAPDELVVVILSLSFRLCVVGASQITPSFTHSLTLWSFLYLYEIIQHSQHPQTLLKIISVNNYSNLIKKHMITVNNRGFLLYRDWLKSILDLNIIYFWRIST